MTVAPAMMLAGLPEDVWEPILWGATGWPCFWATRKGESVERCFWRQLWHGARVYRRGWLADYIDWAWNEARCRAPWRPPAPKEAP